MESPPSTFRKGIGVVSTSVHIGDGGKLAIPGPVAADLQFRSPRGYSELTSSPFSVSPGAGFSRVTKRRTTLRHVPLRHVIVPFAFGTAGRFDNAASCLTRRHCTPTQRTGLTKFWYGRDSEIDALLLCERDRIPRTNGGAFAFP